MWEEILRSPWFYSSPSPLSLLFHGITIYLVARALQKRFTYNYKWIGSLTDGFFLVGFIVLSGDFIWMMLSGYRFLPSYPNSLVQVLSVLGRDSAGMLFCFLLQKPRFGETISFKWHTLIAYAILILFLEINFMIASDPTWTDWTYAIRQNCSTEYILKAFTVNWIGGKIITSLLVYSWFKS